MPSIKSINGNEINNNLQQMATYSNNVNMEVNNNGCNICKLYDVNDSKYVNYIDNNIGISKTLDDNGSTRYSFKNCIDENICSEVAYIDVEKKEDTTPPIIKIEPSYNNNYIKNLPITLTISDNESGVNSIKYKFLERGTYKKNLDDCKNIANNDYNDIDIKDSDLYQIELNKTGDYYLCVKAKDISGKESYALSSYSRWEYYKIDATSPEIKNFNFNSDLNKIEYIAEDNDSGIKNIIINNGNEIIVEKDKLNSSSVSDKIEIEKEGIYKIYVQDYAGNVSQKTLIVNNIKNLNFKGIHCYYGNGSGVNSTSLTSCVGKTYMTGTYGYVIFNFSTNEEIKKSICYDTETGGRDNGYKTCYFKNGKSDTKGSDCTIDVNNEEPIYKYEYSCRINRKYKKWGHTNVTYKVKVIFNDGTSKIKELNGKGEHYLFK